jgi:hypothetical protein
MCLVVCRDGLSGDGAVGADLEAVASGPSLTSDVPACQVEPVMSARGCRARAILMASAARSAARRVRFMASSVNTALVSSSTVRPGCWRSGIRTASVSSSRLKPRTGLSNRPR